MGVSLAALSPEREGRVILPRTADSRELTLWGARKSSSALKELPASLLLTPRAPGPRGEPGVLTSRTPSRGSALTSVPVTRGRSSGVCATQGPSLPTPSGQPNPDGTGLGDTKDRLRPNRLGSVRWQVTGDQSPRPEVSTPRTGPRASLPPPSLHLSRFLSSQRSSQSPHCTTLWFSLPLCLPFLHRAITVFRALFTRLFPNHVH